MLNNVKYTPSIQFYLSHPIRSVPLQIGSPAATSTGPPIQWPVPRSCAGTTRAARHWRCDGRRRPGLRPQGSETLGVAVGKNQGIWPAKNTKKHGISHDFTDFTRKNESSEANIEIQPGEIRIEGGKYGTKATKIRIEPAKMVVEEIKYIFG